MSSLPRAVEALPKLKMAYSKWAALAALSTSLAGCGGSEGGGPTDGTRILGGDTGGSTSLPDGSGGAVGAGGSDTATGGATDSGGSGGMTAAGGTGTGGGEQTGGSGGTDPLPTCDGVDCGNGSCVISEGQAACACDLGWKGDSCSEAIVDGCAEDPCAHGACQDEGSGSYSCACDEGYTGANCDSNIDDCEVDPCDQGACVDEVNGFSCECDVGFDGPTCSNNIDDCDPDPCQNGRCSDDIDSYSCACDFGWTGSTCAEAVNSCQDNPCAQGSCVDVAPGQYSCDCQTGWGGINCDQCATDYTLEGGECIQQKQVDCRDVSPQNASSISSKVSISFTSQNGWSVAAACAFECKAGWQGATCEDSINDCQQHECKNGSDCEDGHLGYSCDCPAGFSGDLCEINVDNCDQEPCDHGVCEDGIDSYSCECDTGWAGDNCGTCATDYTLENSQCIHEKQVSCVDASPPNASSTPGSVTVTYTTGQGWSTAADCAFSCNAGWTGASCNQSVNDCGDNACENGAQCVDEHQSYTCSCVTGYEGQYCESNIDDCEDDPCNGSSCIDGVNSYTCNCNTGYTGQNCDSCATNYTDEGGGCINQKGATCVDVAPANASSVGESVIITYDSNNGWSTPPDCSFVCNAGWTGEDCSEADGDVGLIDSFDTCDTSIEVLEGRSGDWYFYHGTSVGGWTGEVGDPGWDAGCGAWMEGGALDFDDLYAGMGFGLNDNGPLYDASAYDNIQVTYSSDQNVLFFAKWDDVGIDGTRASIELDATVGLKTVTIPLSSFAGIDKSALTEFQFEPTAINGGFGIAVYEVSFTGGQVSACDNGDTRCASGELELCTDGEWGASSCAADEVCSGDRCVDADATPVAVHGHLSVKNGRLVDETDGLVQLKGVSTHWLNYADDDNYETNKSALVWMRDNWNLSVIRAAMGVEEDGGYLQSSAGKAKMLEDIDDIVTNAVEAGVYVIIDWHTHNTQQAGAQQFFEDMVGLYGHLPNVLYEIYNEPLNISWSGTLKPYHEGVLSRIRSAESNRGLSKPGIVIMGTPVWDQNVDDVIGDEVAGTNVMYTVHFYSCDHQASLLNKAKSALSAGVPIFVTEWGATKADGGVNGSAICTDAADAWHTWMNDNSLSWAAWKLDDCDWEIGSRGVADSSCLLKKDVSPSGGWTDSDLNGHGLYVSQKMKN